MMNIERIDIKKCTDIEELRVEALRLVSLVRVHVEDAHRKKQRLDKAEEKLEAVDDILKSVKGFSEAAKGLGSDIEFYKLALDEIRKAIESTGE